MMSSLKTPAFVNVFRRPETSSKLVNFRQGREHGRKTDLLVLFVEIDRILNKEKQTLDTSKVGAAIETFYERVDREMTEPSGDDDLQTYFKTTVQATNDRISRVNRGRVIRKFILAA